MSFLFPIYLVFSSVLSIFLNVVFNNRNLDNRVIRMWGWASARMFGVTVDVKGLENIPKCGYILLFNHTSFFDIFSIFAVLPEVRFGAKIELFRIPFFGRAMKRSGVLPIARQRKEEVFKVYDEAVIRLQKGEKFALAPEGTRQDSEALGPFKAGPFVFAINAQAPLVPMVIQGAAQILPKHHWFPNWNVWHRKIQITILPAVSTKGLSLQDRPKLQNQVREMMSRYLPLKENIT